MNTYEPLLKYILPQEIVEHFDLINVIEVPGQLLNDGTVEQDLHIYVDEKLTDMSGLGLTPNGYTEPTEINDFPLRDRKVVLHVRRRRWLNESRKNVTSGWDLTEKGTRYSKEFAAFLKEVFR